MARKRNFKRAMLGDIVQIPLSKGFAYAQYVNNHKAPPTWGNLLRILPGIYSEKQTNYSELAEMEELYYQFFPLGPALNKTDITLVSNEEIPERCKEFPLFKSFQHILRLFHPKKPKKKLKMWYLSRFLPDGSIEEESLIGDLPKKYYDLSVESIVNDTALIEKIESGWHPRDEVDFENW